MYSQSTLFGENLALIQFGVRHEKDFEFESLFFEHWPTDWNIFTS